VKRRILVLGILVLVLGLPGLVRAESEGGLFRQKLVQLRDERKAKVVENINSMLCTKNKNHTDALFRQLERLGKILDRIEATGKADAGVVTSVSAARTAIATAKTAVEAQAAKPCSINFSGDKTKLGGEVKAAIETMRKDLLSVREKVKAARVETRKAIVALGKVLGENLDNE
jgi:hypothetical protein